ncbi:MAG: hypothetical protein FWE09_05355 [Treponema sp.]|nr:hypothetical protein [Treponema sp.]
MFKRIPIALLFGAIVVVGAQAQDHTVYTVPGSSFRLILSATIDGVLDGLESEFGLLYMPDNVFNDAAWHVSRRPTASFQWFWDRGFSYIGIYDSSDGDFNVAIVRLDRVPNIEWKGFYYTRGDRRWMRLTDEWVDNNMFRW